MDYCIGNAAEKYFLRYCHRLTSFHLHELVQNSQNKFGKHLHTNINTKRCTELSDFLLP